jgi:hypothetical protein
MFQTKARFGSSIRLATMLPVLCAALAFATLCVLVSAQERKTVTIIMVDGKTGKPIKPANYIIRFDYHDATRNEVLHLDDEGVGTVYVPTEASMISVQGTYRASMDIYINCDADMQKDNSTLHWYNIGDIVTSGTVAPNECYKGKYAEATRLGPKPGTFIFYVRAAGWRDLHSD